MKDRREEISFFSFIVDSTRRKTYAINLAPVSINDFICFCLDTTSSFKASLSLCPPPPIVLSILFGELNGFPPLLEFKPEPPS